MNIKQQFKEGLITNNPVLMQLIGMCATMAITTSLFNGIGMGLSVLVILTCCNVVISLIRKVIPHDIRLAIYVLVIASFVKVVALLLQAYVPALRGKGSFGTGIFNTIDGVIGTGNGIQIFPAEYGALVLTLPIGGFITLGCLIALMQYALRKSAEKKEAKEKALAAQEKEAA